MIYKNLTTEVENLIEKTINESKNKNISEIFPETFLNVILKNDTILRNILDDLEVDINGIQEAIRQFIEHEFNKYEDSDKNFSTAFRNLFEDAYNLAIMNKDKYLALDIVLIAGIAEGGVFYNILNSFVDLDLLEMYIKSLRGDRKINEKSYKEQSFLTTFCENLNQKYIDGRTDLVFGRIDEIDRVANILTKRTKNNPILVGEPGVGKTAIVEGIAAKIVEHDIENLDDCIIWDLNLSSLKSNANPNEVAGRMNGLINEIRRKNVIDKKINVLFIDEIHLIVEGGMDLANILKPALARGELKTIGATTIKEYNKYFEKDAAIQRRFQIVKVDEPDEEESLTILRGTQEKIEKFHNISISPESVVAAVRLSKKFITDRFLPDKAIDLIDEAASVRSNSRFLESKKIKQLRLDVESLNFKIKTIEKSLLISEKETFVEKQQNILKHLNDSLVEKTKELNDEIQKFEESKNVRKEIMQLKNELKELEQLVFNAKSSLDVATAIELETKEIPQKLKMIEEIQSTFEEVTVEPDDIAEVVENWTGIPTQKIKETSSNNNIKNIESILKSKIFGQDKAIEAVSKNIRRSIAGISDSTKPVGSFIFLGPTGTGKTETAKCVADAVFGDKTNMIRFDMSEFQEAHTVSKFIGSPAGYVGHDDGGQLTNAVKRQPYSLLLFDEIEKAHPKVFDVLLQVLSDGRLRDGKGTVVDFTNTIIIFTSNIGGSELAAIPNEKVRNDEKMRLLQKTYRPEFLNRLDDIIVFEQLDTIGLINILNLEIEKLQEKLWDDKFISILVSDEFKIKLISSIDIPEFGARPLKRLVYSEIEDKLTDLILDDILKPGDEIVFSITENNEKNIEVY